MFIQRQTKINLIRNAILAWIWKSNISLAWLLFSLLAPLEVKFKNTLNPQIKYAIWFFFKSLLFHFLVYVNSEFWRNHYQWMVSRFDLFIFIVLQRKCLFTYTFYIRSLFSYLYNWTWPNLASTRSWMYQDWLFWWTSLSRVSAVGIRKWRHPFFEIFYPSLPLVIHFTK